MELILKKILRYSLFALFGAGLALVIYPTHDVWLTYKYRNFTPAEIVQAYHDASLFGDDITVRFLSRSHNYQQNVFELPDNAALMFIRVDSVQTSPMQTYVYSYFKYGVMDYRNAPSVICVRIREALHYEDGVWRIGYGKVLDIGYDRIKNFDNLNVGV